jgi:hypothetical protein
MSFLPTCMFREFFHWLHDAPKVSGSSKNMKKHENMHFWTPPPKKKIRFENMYTSTFFTWSFYTPMLCIRWIKSDDNRRRGTGFLQPLGYSSLLLMLLLCQISGFLLQVANLLRLFRIPQISPASTSKERGHNIQDDISTSGYIQAHIS